MREGNAATLRAHPGKSQFDPLGFNETARQCWKHRRAKAHTDYQNPVQVETIIQVPAAADL